MQSIEGISSEFAEQMYQRYCRDPKSVPASWEAFFLGGSLQAPQRVEGDSFCDRLRVEQLLYAYRTYGHLAAAVNPLATDALEFPAELSLERWGFSPSELQNLFPSAGLIHQGRAPLENIIARLQEIYCCAVGYEYMGLGRFSLEKWVQEQIEGTSKVGALKVEQKKEILRLLNHAEVFEAFLHTKFVGQKRFSLEGAETFIPLLWAVLSGSSRLGIEEVVLGMSHRGRLNVLANILKKSHAEIFAEFDEGYFSDSFEGSGDVKYHKGFLSDQVDIAGHQVRIHLTPNPSHLESVASVVQGQVRAKQEALGNKKVMAIQVHGDAALSGQGVVYETLQLYNLPGYATGGTIHLVINNQVGFTTSPEEGRSTRYCTDIAKTFGFPVLHVNAEDPEACVQVAFLAAGLRHHFGIDVFIDLNCYRKYGHNEGDEPAFTQPLEYQKIRSKQSIRVLYRDQLEHEGSVEKQAVEQLEVDFRKQLVEAQQESSILKIKKQPQTVLHKKESVSIHKFPKELLEQLKRAILEYPKGFTVHNKIAQLMHERQEMVVGSRSIDWGMGEFLAFATLIQEGMGVRLSGQDSGRGTFSHRHALLIDQKTAEVYCPLAAQSTGPKVEILNSPLSEFAVMGFEYGYSTIAEKSLVLWEAQFGDFCNEAQVIIDQYIASAEQKWGQSSAITLLLPHGYEGQGPEHSSARLERFLSLAGHENMRICVPSTPAQFFHLLRKQALDASRKPLIVMTPKLLLRLPACVSSLQELTEGSFQPILADKRMLKTPDRLCLCSGKVFYDLDQIREERKWNIALVRIEQLYPLREELLRDLFKQYAHVRSVVWVQEEPSNMGAWHYMKPRLEALLATGQELSYSGRPRSASPAAGSYALHKKELEDIFASIEV